MRTHILANPASEHLRMVACDKTHRRHPGCAAPACRANAARASGCWASYTTTAKLRVRFRCKTWTPLFPTIQFCAASRRPHHLREFACAESCGSRRAHSGPARRPLRARRSWPSHWPHCRSSDGTFLTVDRVHSHARRLPGRRELILKIFTSKGVTSAGDALTTPKSLQGYQDARDAGEFACACAAT